jgi:hypothetical protein
VILPGVGREIARRAGRRPLTYLPSLPDRRLREAPLSDTAAVSNQEGRPVIGLGFTASTHSLLGPTPIATRSIAFDAQQDRKHNLEREQQPRDIETQRQRVKTEDLNQRPPTSSSDQPSKMFVDVRYLLIMTVERDLDTELSHWATTAPSAGKKPCQPC